MIGLDHVERILGKGAILHVSPDVEENMQSHFWHGGDIATISYKGVDFTIVANGDIKANLYYKSENVPFAAVNEKNAPIASVKDKSNQAGFYFAMAEYIKDDENLDKLLLEKHESLRLDLANNNWWELFVEKDGEEVYESVVLGNELLNEAIEEACNMAEEILQNLKQEELK